MLLREATILVIDAYDSFTNNIISLLSTDLDCHVRVIQIDTPLSDLELRNELRHYDAIVCGPGPGDPSKDEDAGLMKRIWRLADEDLIPVLGICLGFQSLALAYGASIRRLNQGLHGIIRHIDHVGQSSTATMGYKDTIFRSSGVIEATLYHSLCVDTGHEAFSNSEFDQKMWLPTQRCPDLQPLAWCIQEDAKDPRILMAIKHIRKPFWGIQYHPESICTNIEGKSPIRSWYESAQTWNQSQARQIIRNGTSTIGQQPPPISLLNEFRHKHYRVCDGHGTRSTDTKAHVHSRLLWKSLQLPDGVDILIPDLALHMNGAHAKQIVLESTNANLPDPSYGITDVRGRYSIIALGVDDAMQIEYRCGSGLVKQTESTCKINGSDSTRTIPYTISLDGTSIWAYLAGVAEQRALSFDVSYPDVPFWGGFLGYSTYEVGLENIGVNITRNGAHEQQTSSRPDVHFAWITSSLVIDHRLNRVYVQYIQEFDACLQHDQEGTISTSTTLDCAFEQLRMFVECRLSHNAIIDRSSCASSFSAKIKLPPASEYEAKVSECQEHIRAGDSYELCLTDQTIITPTPLKRVEPFDIYKRLRATQPAPMASYVRLGNCTYISASPERFLSWDASGNCSLRPMKGTVKKTGSITSLAQATSLLNVPKERAENLMIVDLVRHDLHIICGPGGVTVPKLMEIEEYASVFQMITEVQGLIPAPAASGCSYTERYTGIDVLAASLPPGSMTGAPKKRSCELLRMIECERDRSLYSGVVGYIDAGGRGDFSVNIRCLYKWDEEDHWCAGAGGAVTGLSTATAEREEMMAKLSGTLRLFEHI